MFKLCHSLHFSNLCATPFISPIFSKYSKSYFSKMSNVFVEISYTLKRQVNVYYRQCKECRKICNSLQYRVPKMVKLSTFDVLSDCDSCKNCHIVRKFVIQRKIINISLGKKKLSLPRWSFSQVGLMRLTSHRVKK